MLVDAKLCIFHILPEQFILHGKKIKLLNFCLLHAKYIIFLRWKDIHGPQINGKVDILG